MMIEFDAQNHIFHLCPGCDTSYAFAVGKGGRLDHLYFGPRIKSSDLLDLYTPALRSFAPYPADGDPLDSPEVSNSEFAMFNTGDFRTPSLLVMGEGGHRASEALYSTHRIFKGTRTLPGLPAARGTEENAETLEVVLLDVVLGLEYTLYYTVFRDSEVMSRSVKVRNLSRQSVYLEKVSSLTLDLDGALHDPELLSLAGGYGTERNLERQALRRGITVLSSSRGFSSHNHNPAFALAESDCTEDHGRVYGLMLLYSGSFASEVEYDQFFRVRVQMSINPASFRWYLAPGESFDTPEAVMCVSDHGLGSMSHSFHEFFRKHLLNFPGWKKPGRPLLINSWEAVYFNFDRGKLLELAQCAGKCGMDLFVLDDGWFGQRNDDTTSLGDWVVNEEKLGGTLSSLVEKINEYGLEFGIWMEPEMVSPDSDLLTAHPDWCLCIPRRESSLSRAQLVLDMSRQDVRDYLFESISQVLDSAPVRYIKWDCNRSLTEVGSLTLPPERQLETSHRYILGVYELMQRLRDRYPDLLIESCAGGGGRFDAGMLYYTPQIWCSDNTDAVERLSIQHGTSLFYPPECIGAHISAELNHQTGRRMPFEARAITAFAGTGGFELDLTVMDEEQLAELREDCRCFRDLHYVVENGRLYRLTAPDDYAVVWMNVAADGSEFLLSAVVPRVGAVYSDRVITVRLKGLNPDAEYSQPDGSKYSGRRLLNYGFQLPLAEYDGSAWLWHFKLVK